MVAISAPANSAPRARLNFTMAGVSGFGTCSYGASGITTSYARTTRFTDDGNHGDYAALLNQFTAAPMRSAGSTRRGSTAAFLCPYFTHTRPSE